MGVSPAWMLGIFAFMVLFAIFTLVGMARQNNKNEPPAPGEGTNVQQTVQPGETNGTNGNISQSN